MSTFNYKAPFEQSPAFIVMIDTTFIIAAVSNLYLSGTKTIRENIIGKNIFDVFPDNPEDAGADGATNIQASFNRVINNKIIDTIPVLKYDIPRPVAEGGGFTVKYWKLIHSPVLNELNKVEYIIQLVEDVTENAILIAQLEAEKKILKQVTDSEKRYNLLLMKSPFAFAVFKGKEMIITLANDSIKKIWGKDNEIEGKPLFDVLPELRNSPFPDLINKVYTTGIPFYGNELLAPLQRDGKLDNLYFNFIYQPYLEADETISGVTVIVYEVTAQVILKKAVADKLEAETRAFKRIEESNKRFYMMLMQSPFAFSILKGKNLVVTLANDLMKEILGKGKKIEGKSILEVLPKLINHPIINIIDKVLTNGKPYFTNEIMARLKHQNKLKSKYFNIIIQPDIQPDQTISGVIIIAYEVSEMVQARKIAEESKYRFQAAVEAVQGILWTSKANGEVEGMQHGWALLTGQSIEEYKGYGWSNIIHPEDKAPTLKAWRKAIKAKKKFIFEHRLKLKDGNWGLFSINAIPLFGIDGSVLEWVGVHTNISKQRRAEEALKESENKFKQLVDSMPQKIFKSDANGNIIFFNQQWLNDTGLKMEELKKDGWKKALHPDDLLSTEKNWAVAVNSGNTLNIEYRILDKKGDYRWHLSRSVSIKDNLGNISMWVGSNTDIQEQKEQKTLLEKAVSERTRALDDANKILLIQNEEQQIRARDLIILSSDLKIQQEKLSKANWLLISEEEKVKIINQQLYKLNQELEQRVAKRTRALQESEYRFRSMMETIPQMAWTQTIDQKVSFFNQRWYEYTGLNFGDTTLSGWQKVIYPDDLQDTLIQFRTILKTTEGGGFQTRLQSSDKKYRWHLIRLMPVKNEAGKTQLWVGTATDIQEIKLLQQQKDDFISIASHELKTPVTSLKISLQLLNDLKDSLSSPFVANLIIQANRSLDKFIVLINTLLDTSKVNDGQLHLNKKLIILSKIIDDCCGYVRQQGIYIVEIKGDMRVQVYADPERIEQIIINFLNNAIKYAPESKRIKIFIEKVNGMVKISVTDEGPGIEKENIEHLFERYYQINDNGTHYSTGLGLGLYISAQIVKRHRGQIGVDSQPGKGSSFWFTLPLD